MINPEPIYTVIDEAESVMRELETIDDESLLKNPERARATKKLLYVAHLFDKARMLTMDEYHRFKGGGE